MSWSDPNLEKRASVENQNYSDRMNAQSELWRIKRREDQFNEQINQGNYVGSRQRSFSDGRAGYIGLFFIGMIIVGILTNPSELTLDTSKISMIQLWLGATIAMFIMLFISLTMINRGQEPFLIKLRKRFVFCVVLSVIIGTILIARLSLI